MSDRFDFAFQIIEHKVLYRGFLPITGYRIRHQLFAGGFSGVLGRECLLRGPAVAVLPYDPARDRVILIEQFRVGAMVATAKPWLLEIVAGLQEPGETAVTVAHREAHEEAGCELLALEPISEFFPSPGGSSEYVKLYCAQVDSQHLGGLHGLDEEHEDIRVHVLGRPQALEWVDQGVINTAPALIALLWLQLHYPRLQASWHTSGTG